MSYLSNVVTWDVAIPLTGVVDNRINLVGEDRDVVLNQTGTYSTPFPASHCNVWMDINSRTGDGTITVNGTSVDYLTGLVTIGDSEVITVDSNANYCTTKKWWEVTSVVPAGFTAIDYDISVLEAANFFGGAYKVLGYRLDAYASSDTADFRFRIIKVRDRQVELGPNRISFTDIEDIGVDSGAAGAQIIDNLRDSANDRSYTPTSSNIWLDDTTLVLSQLDFDSYFASIGENFNVFRTDTEALTGIQVRIEGEGGGISNVDFVHMMIHFIPLK